MIFISIKCGNIKEVRIVKERATGKPKGFAYIDFEDEIALLKALKFNQTELNGQIIVVARSNPPKKSTEGEFSFTPEGETFSKPTKPIQNKEEELKVPKGPK